MNIDKDTKQLIVDSEVLLRRLLAVSKKRDVSLEKVLQHKLAVIPPALFHEDGSLRKCVKADLAWKFESTTDEIVELSSCYDYGIYIYGGMALIQDLHEAQFIICRDMAHLITSKVAVLLNGPWCITSVVLVFDPYDVPNFV